MSNIAYEMAYKICAPHGPLLDCPDEFTVNDILIFNEIVYEIEAAGPKLVGVRTVEAAVVGERFLKSRVFTYRLVVINCSNPWPLPRGKVIKRTAFDLIYAFPKRLLRVDEATRTKEIEKRNILAAKRLAGADDSCDLRPIFGNNNRASDAQDSQEILS